MQAVLKNLLHQSSLKPPSNSVLPPPVVGGPSADFLILPATSRRDAVGFLVQTREVR